VVHNNSIHDVAVDYCGCKDETVVGSRRQQLLRRSWYPATHKEPRTCTTFVGLETFHIMTLQGKVTTYNYYSGLEKLTDNTGLVKVKVSFFFVWEERASADQRTIRIGTNRSCIQCANGATCSCLNEQHEATIRIVSLQRQRQASWRSYARHVPDQRSIYLMTGSRPRWRRGKRIGSVRINSKLIEQ
jgi:hypothetical protein